MDLLRVSMFPNATTHIRLIEECMIAANVQAAKFLRKHRIPGLYRNHAKPDPDRFDELRLYLVSLGLKVPHSDHVEPRDFRKLIEQVSDRPDATAISMAMLRSMTHAEYAPKNIGHFGLALDAYAHFTSPIRRYPDLLVHRAIRHIVRGGKPAKYGHDSDEDATARGDMFAARTTRRRGDSRRRSVAQVPVHGIEARSGICRGNHRRNKLRCFCTNIYATDRWARARQ